MTPETGRTFLPAIRELERRLTLPLPRRTRLLLELEYDLEQLRRRFLAQGMAADEAVRRALDTLMPEGATVDELGMLHQPLYQRATRHLDGQRLRLAERGALALATASVLAAQTALLLEADLLSNPSAFLLPVLALGAALGAAVVARVFRLWVKGDHQRPSRGPQALLILSGLILLTGMSGALLDFIHLAGTVEANPELAPAYVLRQVVRDAALLAVSLILALAGSLAWFVIAQWHALASGAHLEFLGLEPGSLQPLRPESSP